MPTTGNRSPTKRERREAARREREQRELAEQQRARRTRRLRMLGGVGILVVLLVGAAIAISSAGGDDPGAAGGGGATGADETAALFDGIPQKGVALGREDAPVTVVELGDLQCPACKAFAADVLPGIVRDYVRPGRVKLELRTLAFIGEDSTEAARAAAGAARQDRLWQFADLFYRNQGTENTGYVTDDYLRTLARAVPGLDAERVLAFRDGGRSVSDAQAIAQRYGVDSTPSFLIARRGEPLRLVTETPDRLPRAIERELRG